MSATTLLETVAVFDTAANFQDAIDELMSSGFDRELAPLPLLASSSVTAVHWRRKSTGPSSPARLAA